MARTDNLTNFCEDIADSIRTVTGKTNKIQANQFDTEIRALSTEPVLQSKELTIYENQKLNITADEGFDALDKVDVNLKVGTKVLWLIKDGIEQTENTGGSSVVFMGGENQPGGVTQGDGYILGNAKVWSHYALKFNNKIDLNKYTRAYIDFDYPNTSSPYAKQYAGFSLALKDSQLEKALKSSTTMKRSVKEVQLDSHLDEDELMLYFINTYDYSYGYGFRVYNMWLEGEPTSVEDLTDELSTQETAIESQEISIEDIQNALLGKMAGGGSSMSSNLSIFIQEGEPLSRDGIWFKTSKEIPYNSIIQKIITKPFKWTVSKNDDKNLPYSRDVGVASIGTDLYIFGGQTMYNEYKNFARKLDVLTNTYTTLAGIPYSARGIMAMDYGTDIYLFGGLGTNSKYYDTIYKYDTINNNYTLIGNMPIPLYLGGIAKVGTNIYIIGGGTTGGGNSNGLYKFDVLNNTFEKVAILNEAVSCCAVCSLDTNIYIFGGWTDTVTNHCWKFDTLTNTISAIADYPITILTGIANTYRDKILVAGGDTDANENYTDKTYLYDPKTDTYTEQAKLWTNAGLGRWCGSAKIGADIYAPGGSWNPKIGGGGGELSTITRCVVEEEIYSYLGNDKCLILPIHSQLENNEILIQNTNDLTFKILMLDCLYYDPENRFDMSTETYYGNGSEWIKIIR